ncbi:asparagine synthase (glutamine-hydrolyzing) [Pigmentibacter sp. JX0631]|uniref:asparagine synthase (glutamine-hydrolyzing) n=1 Tax=Pigmentibacter sp. JX0631 TaxID=2976982 RepID=UPI002468B2A8|nr:asparagine synthase (glutamine-hydrolyzing) [Pigmentibacter sp. JX0631]WGL60821.1 asparagine synthase (glutamine-hydrolyzing) [Pigmentibacter sp. JX0631]
MCGIFGIISRPNVFNEKIVRDALNKISHRGPDDWGLEKLELKDKWDVWFGQRRLSIIDLSSAGHQPMTKFLPDNIISLCFNGEIYNFNQLKEQLKDNWKFQSGTDTEVILAGIHLLGNDFLKKLNGMLAMAFFNQNEHKITFARDRLGKKPLYIYKSKDCIAFSSELKSIINLKLPLTINNEALEFYRWLGYIPANLTIYNECFKLSAGSYLNLDLSKNNLELENETLYWDPFIGYGRQYKHSYDEAIDEFLELLDDATKIRLVSDVPVGAFLSGGIDSSLVLSSIKKLNIPNFQSFTVQYDNKEFDESSIAIETSNNLDIPIQLLHLKESDYQNQILKIPFHYDEPFSDSSQIPTMAISEAARKFVTVVLTGDGGDEVFLGYPRFSYTKKLVIINQLTKLIPFLNKTIASSLKTKLGKILFRKILNLFSVNSTNLDSKLEKINEILSAKNEFQLYDIILRTNPKSKTNNPLNNFNSYFEFTKNWYPNYSWQNLDNRSIEEKFAALDLVTYLRDDVLVKVDRATMAYSLEARSPLLDYRIVEFGTSLPLHFKIQNNVYKKILRDALARRTQGKVLSMPKKGFGVPLPANLPNGSNLNSRWNLFIENEWEKYTKQHS